ncbi:MAG: hypothetical protein E7175_05680 [Erysipelotrichaceae bacterium]|nr:hypothetical protein [Erysipelotrichaceae bacterium]
MKKSLLFSIGTLFSLLFTSCSGSSCNCPKEDGGHDYEVSLEKDVLDNYAFDADSTNKDGSMSYEIFVRSFYDTNNDGTGDIKGVTAKLPYLADLGIKTLWLMPIHPSPTYHGYDVKDYYAVNPDYGTLADFDELVSEANKLNIDIMLDMVFNHSSTQIPWFNKSYEDYKAKKSGTDSKADWYNWSTSSKSGYSKYKDLYYEARFDSSMPDLNFDSASMRKEIEKIFSFWIKDHGIKGFRLDAVLYYYYGNADKNAEVLTWMEKVGKDNNKDFYMVGEAWTDNSTTLEYYKSKCDSFFKFKSSLDGKANDAMMNIIRSSSAIVPYDANGKWAKAIQKYEASVKENNPDGYSSYFLSNHDMDRCGDSLEECFMKSAASLYGLMPGTSFMYYGEEIYLKGKRVTDPDDMSDARRRLPMIWSKSDKTGECKFPEKGREDLDDNEQVEEGANDLMKVGYSLPNHFKKVINVRNKYPFIKHSVFTSLVDKLNRSDNQYLMAYKLSLGNDYIIVVHNFNQYAVEMDAPGNEIVDEINTNRQKPRLKDGKLALGAYSTVVMK